MPYNVVKCIPVFFFGKYNFMHFERHFFHFKQPRRQTAANPILVGVKYLCFRLILRARKKILDLPCGASGLNFSIVLTPVELVLKSGILKETKHIIK